MNHPPQQIDPVSKAKVLLEALPYIQRFQGSTFVIKYGGGFMDDPDLELRLRVVKDIVLLAAVGIKVVVVHGGGKAISRAIEAAGLKTEFRDGLRVTDEASIKIVEKVLNSDINGEICDLITAQNGRALGMPGNTIFHCEKWEESDASGNPVDLGYVGRVTEVKTALIESAFASGYVPVVSPIAQDTTGTSYNSNADIAAAHVASALQARRLVFLCDVPGLLRDPADQDSIISTLTADAVNGLKEDGVITSGMLPKVDSAVSALAAGVHRVHFVDGRMPHSVLLEIFTDEGIGTEIINT